MKILADEGIDRPIVESLRNAGFDVHYVLETHQGVDDDEVLQLANLEQRLLLTQDKDFGELIFRLNKIHLGIILLRLGRRTSEEKAVIVTQLFLKHHEELVEAFSVIQPNAIRIRRK